MEKNNLNRVVWVVLAVVLGLLALYWLPEVRIAGWTMRKIDLLADLRIDTAATMEETTLSSDSTLVGAVLSSKKVSSLNIPLLEGSRLTHDRHGNVITLEDSIINAVAQQSPQKDGVTSIVDMSGGAQGGMDAFYNALDIADLRPVYVAVLGDSYIEGDILTAMLRELLQQRFGGTGCGYLPMTSIVANTRMTVRQTFDGWTQHKAIDRNGYVNTFNNITGNYFGATQGAWVNLSGSGYRYKRTASCTSSSFYYLGGGGTGSVTAYVNGERFREFSLIDYNDVNKVTVTGDINNVKWVVDNPSSIIYLGTSMDCSRGVIVDNLSMRSASGRHLKNIPDRLLTDFNRLRPYDLIVIMYGLNVAGNVKSQFTAYSNELQQGIDNLKRCLPGTSILLVSCSDREERTAQGFRTMNGVLGLIQAQKRVAINSRVAFWNLYDAMGGEGSIVNMVNKGEAARDYTHLTGRGGDRIARLLYDALMLGYEHR